MDYGSDLQPRISGPRPSARARIITSHLHLLLRSRPFAGCASPPVPRPKAVGPAAAAAPCAQGPAPSQQPGPGGPEGPAAPRAPGPSATASAYYLTCLLPDGPTPTTHNPQPEFPVSRFPVLRFAPITPQPTTTTTTTTTTTAGRNRLNREPRLSPPAASRQQPAGERGEARLLRLRRN
jgi:hypothetical protein